MRSLKQRGRPVNSSDPAFISILFSSFARHYGRLLATPFGWTQHWCNSPTVRSCLEHEHIGTIMRSWCGQGPSCLRVTERLGERNPMSEKIDPKDTCVLVTGGAGFIGSHTVVELLQKDYKVVIVDDLSNASAKVEDRIKTIVGPEAAKNLELVIADVNDRAALEQIFDTHTIDRVIHFAGLQGRGRVRLQADRVLLQQPRPARSRSSTSCASTAASPSSSPPPPRYTATRTPVPLTEDQPQEERHQPLWLDQVDDRADPDATSTRLTPSGTSCSSATSTPSAPIHRGLHGRGPQGHPQQPRCPTSRRPPSASCEDRPRLRR